MRGALCLEDGSIYRGSLSGSCRSVCGEVVFQTGMVGYPESLTDPSYHQQILILTYPMIGNYGVPSEDEKNGNSLSTWMESSKVYPTALVVSDLSKQFSHWSAKMSLHQWLKLCNVPVLEGIDTRKLTTELREKGTVRGKIIVGDSFPVPVHFDAQMLRNLVDEVSIKNPSDLYNPTGSPKVLVVDCGLKYHQLRCLLSRDVCLQVVPWNHPIQQEMAHFDGLFISNGPGDPALCDVLISNIASYMKELNMKPVFGICMGHQIIALAAGLTTYRLKYGNRGHNQPCILQGTSKCYITSQNHGFAVDVNNVSLPWEKLFTNANDHTNEGLINREKPVFSVQFHPEHRAGPSDTECLFDVFIESMHKFKDGHFCSMKEILFNKLNKIPAPKHPVFAFKPRKVIILGSGGLSIGQAGEFDYCGSQAIKALKEEDISTVLINPNIATVQTSKGLATKVYFLPITCEYVAQVIKAERPDGILLNFGGQTALNCGIELVEQGILNQYDVKVLGTPVQVIKWTEDRQLFAEKLAEIGYRVAPSQVAYSVQEARNAAAVLGYPVLVRAAYSLGGLNSGFADNDDELVNITSKALAVSAQLLIDKSLKGWKEIEYEVVRDVFDNCITVCNMENIDPLGIHTGESVVVAPSQTLNDSEYQLLRSAAIEIIRHLGVVGECNIQYALNPSSEEFFIVEVNARLSRSSALASKATGYPLAYIAAKLSIGHSLVAQRNPVTGVTTACFEPSLDYCVVKVPRWDFNKFTGSSKLIGSSMKSIGEVMAVGRNFEEAFQKALRMVDELCTGFDPYFHKVTDEVLANPTSNRTLVLATALAEGYSVDRLHELTNIDRWFLSRMKNIINFRTHLCSLKENPLQLTRDVLLSAKQLGFSDFQIAKCIRSTEHAVRTKRQTFDLHPWVNQIDTVAGEWPACANYLYLTYNAMKHDVVFSPVDVLSTAVMVLGSGVYRIGSSVEFDCCAVACLHELRRLGRSTIMVNCNPETVSTDYDTCDRLYFEEISLEVVMEIYQLELPEGIILSMGGQLPNNIALGLHRQNAVILGTNPESIDNAENRFKFSRLLDAIEIKQPIWRELTSVESAERFCNNVGYPCLIRPSYVLSGAAMKIVHSTDDLEIYLRKAAAVSKDYPVVISKFIENAREFDVDSVAANGEIICLAVSEHVEDAGIHSGDSTLITPPQTLNAQTINEIRQIVASIAEELEVHGPLNLQLMLQDNELLVIEANLRVSRSLPFVSKTLDFDMVAVATRVVLDLPVDPVDITMGKDKRVGVKMPVFSFSRLPDCDVEFGVEMHSTGEVAGYGLSTNEAFLKAFISSGLAFPKNGIFISIGEQHRETLKSSLQILQEIGYKTFGSRETVNFYNKFGIYIQFAEFLTEVSAIPQRFGLVISVPSQNTSSNRVVSDKKTFHLRIRRAAINFNIPVVTDLHIVMLLAKALQQFPHPPTLRLSTDCVTIRRLVRLPGLIDIHVHLREPGATHKEDFDSGTASAIAGGVTMVCCMPNTNPPIVDEESFLEFQRAAKRGARCDYALFVGASTENASVVHNLASQAMTLKMYLCETYTTLKLNDMTLWGPHFQNWPKNRPICVHAESTTLAAVLFFAHLHDKSVHVCHVSKKEEVCLIKEAKKTGHKVTCEVAPHHLFLTERDLVTLGRRGSVKPPLSTAEDQAALWKNLDVIDCFATDHAPHLISEKDSNQSPPGFPGLETMLPLLLTAVHSGRLTIDDIKSRLYDNPRRIFDLPEQPDTFVEIDMDEEWIIPEAMPYSKSKWTPFHGMMMHGKVHRVVLRGEEAFVDGQLVAKPGFGLDVRSKQYASLPTATGQIEPVQSEKPAVVDAPRMLAPAIQITLTASPEIIPEKGKPVKKAVTPAASPVVYGGRGNTGSQDRSSLSPVPGNGPGMRALRRSSIVDRARRSHSTEVPASITEESESDEFAKRVLLSVSPGNVLRRSSAVMPSISSTLPFLHVIRPEIFRKNHLDDLFNLAYYFRSAFQKGRDVEQLLKGKILANLFYESDTHAENAFVVAMQRLGGAAVFMDPTSSSVKKGESLQDTVKIMSSYADVVVLRHFETGAVEDSVWSCAKPLINAGDGIGEDPSQALVDVFTMWDEIGTVHELTVTFVGDLKNDATVHSLAKLLMVYRIAEVRYLAYDGLSVPEETREYIKEHDVKQVDYVSLEEALPETNILYMARLHKNSFQTDEEYQRNCNKFTLTPQLMTLAKHEGRTGPKMRILHRLPRLKEISNELDTDPRAAYFRQAENGLYVRMALLVVLIQGNGGGRRSSQTSLSLKNQLHRRRASTPFG